MMQRFQQTADTTYYLRRNFTYMLQISGYKSVPGLLNAVKTADTKKNKSYHDLVLCQLPANRTLYYFQTPPSDWHPHTDTIQRIVDCYNLFVQQPVTVDEFSSIELEVAFEKNETNPKRELFTGFYSCFYLTAHDHGPVGALLYIDFHDVRNMRAAFIAEISSDTLLQDDSLADFLKTVISLPKSNQLEEAFGKLKGDTRPRTRLQLYLSTALELTRDSLSFSFENIKDPTQRIHIGLNVTQFTKHGMHYLGGWALALSNGNTVNGLSAFPMVIASTEHLSPISMKEKQLMRYLKVNTNTFLKVTPDSDALCYRFLETFVPVENDSN